MTQSDSKRRQAPRTTNVNADGRDQARELAAAGARGHVLTPREVRLICEALQARSHTVRNQFHSGH